MESNLLKLRKADDMHHHFRDGDALKTTVPLAAAQFRRCIAMPNLVPPITTTQEALAYRERILAHVPEGVEFDPLMTLYMTDNTHSDEIKLAYNSRQVFAVKYYPAGATTNSASGVTNIEKIYPTLRTMEEIGMPLLIHGEVTDPNVDVFDREHHFIEDVLRPLVSRFPQLKIVMEHITTTQAAEFVLQTNNVAATITPQHLLYNRNGGLQPHKYCLPVLKREEHRKKLIEVITSGNSKFFLGTDSAPHRVNKKEATCGCAGIFSSPVAIQVYAEIFEYSGCLNNLEDFASRNGATFYGLPLNNEQICLQKTEFLVPSSYPFEENHVVPLKAGEKLQWTIVD